MRRPPRVDFIAPRPVPAVGRVLVLVALAAFAWLAALTWQQHVANQQQQAALRPAPRVGRAAPPVLKNDVERRALLQAHAVAGQMTAPWNDLLAVFEEHSRADIGLLRLEPDARSGRVRLTAEARSLEAMVSYLSAMEADMRLDDVVLMNHQLERDTPGQPVRFTLRAGWRRAMPMRTLRGSQS